MSSEAYSLRAAAYEDMAQLLRQGHVKNALRTADGFCLVGAIDAVAHSSRESQLFQQEVLAELAKSSPFFRAQKFQESLPIKILHIESFSDGTSSDGGLALLEAWNDAPWRRTSTVIAVLEKLAQQYSGEAKDLLIEELTEALAQAKKDRQLLTLRIKELEAKVEELETEVRFWRKTFQLRKAKATAEDLRNSSQDLAELDNRMNTLLQELTSETSTR